MAPLKSSIGPVIASNERKILAEWGRKLREAGALHSGRIKEDELQKQCQQFLTALREALASGNDPDGPGFDRVRDLLEEISRSRAGQGYSVPETANFVFSLKEPI